MRTERALLQLQHASRFNILEDKGLQLEAHMDRLKEQMLKSRASQASNLSLSTSNQPSKTSPKSNLNLLQLPKNLLASSLRQPRLHSFLGIACLFRFGLLLLLVLLVRLFPHAPHLRNSSHRTSAPSLGRQFNRRSELTVRMFHNRSKTRYILVERDHYNLYIYTHTKAKHSLASWSSSRCGFGSGYSF